jgi:hypothetical protein
MKVPAGWVTSQVSGLTNVVFREGELRPAATSLEGVFPTLGQSRRFGVVKTAGRTAAEKRKKKLSAASRRRNRK